MDYFAFATVGTAFITFLMAGMGVFVHLIQEWQSGGTLEVLFNSRTSPVSVVLINALPVLLRYAVTLFITFLAAYALISGNALQLNLGGALLVFVLSALLVCCLGLLAAALQVLFRKGSALLWLSGSSAWLLCGAMYPVEALPAGLQSLSALVPVTYAITAFRKVLLQGASLRDTNPSLTILIALLLVLGPLSVFVFSVSVNAAKRRGLLAYF
jgi:ABC-2 type transport system permease protein